MTSESTDAYVVREPEAEPVPLLVSIPHTGTELLPGMAERFSADSVRELPDTDFHLHQLYDFVPELGARTVYARYSRYVIDLNRPEDGASLYPGRDETGLVPQSTFAGEPIYRTGETPPPAEIEQRLERCYRPYHARLEAELQGLKRRFGYALLFDAHSIRSRVPRFFEGELPGLMLGDVDGSSCVRDIADAVYQVHCDSAYSHGRNAPFKGGHITRSYGQPDAHVHALQLEMSQRLYMQEASPFAFDGSRARELRPVLRATLQTFIDTARERYART